MLHLRKLNCAWLGFYVWSATVRPVTAAARCLALLGYNLAAILHAPHLKQFCGRVDVLGQPALEKQQPWRAMRLSTALLSSFPCALNSAAKAAAQPNTQTDSSMARGCEQPCQFELRRHSGRSGFGRCPEPVQDHAAGRAGARGDSEGCVQGLPGQNAGGQDVGSSCRHVLQDKQTIPQR